MDEKRPPANVILLTAADKQGAAFCAGALVALKEAGLLAEARHVVSAGAANLTSFFVTKALSLAVATRGSKDGVTNEAVAQAWQQICALPVGEFVDRIIVPLREACAASQEELAFRQRLWRPSEWLSPWRHAFQRVVSRDYAMLGHTTASIEISEDTPRVGAPVFAFAGAVERSSSLVVFTTAKRSTKPRCIPGVPLLLPSNSRDLLSNICWGLGTPAPLSGVDAVFSKSEAVVDSVLPVEPIPASVCDDLYLRSRMVHARDKSRCLLLVDAYSRSPAYFDAPLSVQSFADRTVQLLCSAHDSQHETLRLYNRGLSQMYTSVAAGQTQRNALFASRSLRMAALDELEFEEAANWGYFQTAWQYATDVRSQSCDPPFNSDAHQESNKGFLQDHLQAL